MIDDRVIAAKELYAAEMGFENQMRYEMVKASEAGMGRILMWNATKFWFESFFDNKNECTLKTANFAIFLIAQISTSLKSIRPN